MIDENELYLQTLKDVEKMSERSEEEHYQWYLRNSRMITISQLLEMPDKQKFGGSIYNIKTYKKMWPVGKIYYNQVVLMDDTGEILADVKLGEKNIPLRGHCSKIKVIVGEIQPAENMGKPCKKALVTQWENVDEQMSEPPLSDFDKYKLGLEPDCVIRSKIMCWLVSSHIQSGKYTIKDSVDFSESEEIVKITDAIMKGGK